MRFVANAVIVDAFVINEVGVRDRSGQRLYLSDGAQVLASDEMLARIEPKQGDYWVVQSDGYIYVNPKLVFERKYKKCPEDYAELRAQLGDYTSTFYGPTACRDCSVGKDPNKQVIVVRQAQAQGGVSWTLPRNVRPHTTEVQYIVHDCRDESLREMRMALAQSVTLQSHYAELLNSHDGGERRTFSGPDQWLARLRDTKTQEEAQDGEANNSRRSE